MAVFNNNMTIGHGSHVKESATDFKLSLNGVSVSANSKQIVFMSGNRKKTLLMDESVLSAPRPGKPNMEEGKTEYVRKISFVDSSGRNVEMKINDDSLDFEKDVEGEPFFASIPLAWSRK
jgi:hypothetical protein